MDLLKNGRALSSECYLCIGIYLVELAGLLRKDIHLVFLNNAGKGI